MLDLHVLAMLQPLQAAQLPDLADLPIEAARQMYRQIMAGNGPGPAEALVQTQHLSLPGPAGMLPARLYRPTTATAPPADPMDATGKPQPALLPVVLYLHGGGYSLGDLDDYDPICRQLCHDSGLAVLTVAYRLAPEHPMPACVEDCWAALQWLAHEAGGLALDSQRLAVAGDSAGAALAAVLALLARDAGGPALRGQALVYPPAAGGHLHTTRQPAGFASHQAHARGPTLTGRTMQRFNQWAFGPAGCAAGWREAAPLLAPDLSRLPPALVMLAGADALHDEGLAYAHALLAAGTPVTLVDYPALPHGFISMGGPVPAARAAQRQLADTLRRMLA